MRSRPWADAQSMARVRLVLAAALLAASACAYAAAAVGAPSSARSGAAAALDARAATGRTVSSHRRHTRRAARCAKRHSHRKRHLPRCSKRRSTHLRGTNLSKGRHKRGKTHPQRTAHHRRKTPRPASPGKSVQAQPAKPPAAVSVEGGACPNTELAPTQDNLELIRTATLCLVNRERKSHGESALQPSERLERAAQAHTEDMVSENYFEHVSPHGDTPLSRIRATGYIASDRVGYVIGENIAWGTLDLATPGATVKAWIASPEHLANILDARFHDTAIGVSPRVPSSFAHGQAGAIYTEDFGAIVPG
jgi:uncharacterized protein YkwD